MAQRAGLLQVLFTLAQASQAIVKPRLSCNTHGDSPRWMQGSHLSCGSHQHGLPAGNGIDTYLAPRRVMSDFADLSLQTFHGGDAESTATTGTWGNVPDAGDVPDAR